MAQQNEKEFEALFKYDESRRQQYKFGKGDIQYITPSNYPKEEDYKNKPVGGDLILDHVYGYKGNTNNARQNLYHRDGLLIYYNAAVGIVFNPTNRQQQFFVEHSDDITCLCIDPREGSTLVATGQKDPKDNPGQGKDYPKIWIWDYKTMKGIVCIDDVCWGQVNRIQWSPLTGYLYVLCGDKDQTLKAYDIDAIRKGKAKKVLSKDVELLASSSQNTKKLGFLIRPKQCEEAGVKDEIMMHCMNKLQHVQISEDPKKKNGRLQAKFRAISVGNLNKKGENAFITASYLSSGKYVVGASSGMIYICNGAKAINTARAHKDAVFALTVANDGKLYTGGSGKDKTIRIFEVSEEEKGDALKEVYNSGPIHVDGSDFDFQPREMIVHDKHVFVSSKTNQIINYDVENRRGSLLIDGHDGQIHGVATHPSKDIFITIGWDQTVKIWNARSHKCLSTYQFIKGGDPWVWQRKQEEENGEEKKDDPERKIVEDDWNITAITWSSNGRLVAIGTEKSAVAIFEYCTEPKIQLNLIKVFQIPKRNPNNEEIESVSRLRFNKDSSLLAIAHMDGNLYVFGLNDNGKKCVKWAPYSSRAAPSHLQWGDDSQLIRILTRDYEVAYLRLDYKGKTLKRCVKIPDSDKYKWFGGPLLAGWETKGCLQPEMDGTDINDVAVTSDLKLVACGDDHGKVRLHNYPVVLQEPNKCFGGHAEHVQSVEFMGNDNYLISVGGADMSIFQWKLQKNNN